MSNEFSKLSLTEIERLINEKQAFTTDFLNIMITTTSLLLGIVMVAIFIVLSVKKYNFSEFIPVTGVGLFGFFIAGIMIVQFVNAGNDLKALQEAKTQIEQQFKQEQKDYFYGFSEKDIVKVKVDFITNRSELESVYCPNISNLTKCYFIEYKANNEYGQAIVPFNLEQIKKGNEPFTLEQYVLSEEDKKKYIEVLNLENKHIDSEKVDTESLVIGNSLVK